MATSFGKVKRVEVKTALDATFPSFNGRYVTVTLTDKVTTYGLNWDGGVKNEYAAIDAEGNSLFLKPAAWWMETREGATVEIPEGCTVVMHTRYAGGLEAVTVFTKPIQAVQVA